MKHTKGPWKLVRDNNDCLVQDLLDSNGTVITCIHDGDNGYNNANLIVNSPEMFESIEFAKSRLETALKYGPDMASSRELCIQDAIKLLSDVLKKVEG